MPCVCRVRGPVAHVDFPDPQRDCPSFPDRKDVLGRKGGKKPEEKKRSSNLIDRKTYQEDDHGCIRAIIRSLEPTSQGSVSAPALLSAANSGPVCSRSYRVRKCSNATGSRNVMGTAKQRNQNSEL